MTAFALKIIAVICMSIDHIGAVFPSWTPDYFRFIGRIAFPIYAFLIACGCTHTKNMNRYMLRLGIFALISEIPFDLAFDQSHWILRDMPLQVSFINFTNVFYSLFLGVACVNIYEKLKLKANQWLACIPLALLPFSVLLFNHPRAGLMVLLLIGAYAVCVLALSLCLPNAAADREILPHHKILALIPALPIILLGNLLHTDYGMFAIAWILALYLAKTKMIRLLVLLFGVVYEYGLPLLQYSAMLNLPNILMLVCALAAVAVVCFYNGRRGRNLKWAFYWFYPIHLSLLAFILLLFARPALNGF